MPYRPGRRWRLHRLLSPRGQVRTQRSDRTASVLMGSVEGSRVREWGGCNCSLSRRHVVRYRPSKSWKVRRLLSRGPVSSLVLIMSGVRRSCGEDWVRALQRIVQNIGSKGPGRLCNGEQLKLSHSWGDLIRENRRRRKLDHWRK